jgi:hypothetical protein
MESGDQGGSGSRPEPLKVSRAALLAALPIDQLLDAYTRDLSLLSWAIFRPGGVHATCRAVMRLVAF